MNERGTKIGRRLAGAAKSRNGLNGFFESTARTLREACCEAGLDQNGRRCPDCPVGDLCADESRWLVRRAPGAD